MWDTLLPSYLSVQKVRPESVYGSSFYQIGTFPSISYETEEDFVAAGLASAGFGIAILPDHPFLHTMDLKLLTLTDPDPKKNRLSLSCKRNQAIQSGGIFL